MWDYILSLNARTDYYPIENNSEPRTLHTIDHQIWFLLFYFQMQAMNWMNNTAVIQSLLSWDLFVFRLLDIGREFISRDGMYITWLMHITWLNVYHVIECISRDEMYITWRNVYHVTECKSRDEIAQMSISCEGMFHLFGLNSSQLLLVWP